MEIPKPPPDISLQNIIDKLAEFVSRNGLEFEAMTKIKQQGNPKFSFLYGGEYYKYYQYKLNQFQQQQQHTVNQSQVPPPLMSLNNQPSQPIPQVWSIANQAAIVTSAPQANGNLAAFTAQLEAISVQQNTLREQIRQSEQNLQAQHRVLLQQQKNQIEEAISRAQSDYIQRLAIENNINLSELDGILQPIIDNCTKDSISHGKSWILQQTTDSSKCQIISQYLLKKAMVGGAFNQKLHLIYLINDLLHHCVRKNAEDLKKCLEGVVIPMFCNAQMSANDDQNEKLTKLLSLWESKANFFDACVISKLKTPPSSLQEYQNTLLVQHAAVITPLTQATKTTFDKYQQQHQTFVEHASHQLTMLETQKQQIEQQGLKQQPPPLLPELVQQQQQPQQQPAHQIPSLLSINTNAIVPSQIQAQKPGLNQAGSFFSNNQNNSSNNGSSFAQYPVQQGNNSTNNNNSNDSHVQNDFSLPPPNFPIPDLSRPPPGFDSDNPQATQPEVETPPTLPYFDLPAGLMVPLIRLEDYKYKPLDPDSIRLPPPTPPNERLLNAVEAFYAPPSHERPRDSEGWEKLALYEYFKVKNASKKQKEEEIASGMRSRSKSPTPIPGDLIRPPKKVKKRVYRSKSRSPSRSRSRSTSPEPKPSSNNHERSRKRSKSPIPVKTVDRGRDFGRGDSRNDRDRRDRSVTPPSFSMSGMNASKQNDSIEESNKGHQMLKKMGWGGSGGLAGGYGIAEPIQAGQPRDKQDLYKGIGVNLADPYENFRKNKGQAFITRIRSRDDK